MAKVRTGGVSIRKGVLDFIRQNGEKIANAKRGFAAEGRENFFTFLNNPGRVVLLLLRLRSKFLMGSLQYTEWRVTLTVINGLLSWFLQPFLLFFSFFYGQSLISLWKARNTLRGE